MSTKREALNYFGQFLMKNYRDKALKTLDGSLNNHWQGESQKEFQTFLQTLTDQQRKSIFTGFQGIIDGALHDLLFSLEEENNLTKRIKVSVNEYDIVEISDGIHGEQFGNNGWIESFSNHKNNN